MPLPSRRPPTLQAPCGPDPKEKVKPEPAVTRYALQGPQQPTDIATPSLADALLASRDAGAASGSCSSSELDPAVALMATVAPWVDPPEPEARQAGKTASRRATFGLTNRDIEFMRFLTRFKYATRQQLCVRFGLTENAAQKRLPRLVDEGYLKRRVFIAGEFGVYLPTKQGVQISGLQLSVPDFKPGTALHTLGLTDLAADFEAAGHVVISEREIRAADTRASVGWPRSGQPATWASKPTDNPEPLYAVRVGGTRIWPHIPDLILKPRTGINAGLTIAIELELSRKSPLEWQNVLRGYRDATHIDTVHYYCYTLAVAVPLGAVIENLGLQRKVRVIRWRPSESVPKALLSGN